MDLKQKEIHRTLQVLLWLWFGTMTSFTIVNTVNIAKLETQVKNLNDELNDLEKQHRTLKYHTLSKQNYVTNYRTN
jgi:cell division protein FtsB